jgi:hypothetical protein
VQTILAKVEFKLIFGVCIEKKSEKIEKFQFFKAVLNLTFAEFHIYSIPANYLCTYRRASNFDTLPKIFNRFFSEIFAFALFLCGVCKKHELKLEVLQQFQSVIYVFNQA